MLHKDVRHEKHVLSNGAEVFLALSPYATNLAFDLTVMAGSAHERPSEYGAGHALEHALLLGSQNYSRAQTERVQNLWLGEKGASTNKHTISLYCHNGEGVYEGTSTAFAKAGGSGALYDRHAREITQFLWDIVDKPLFEPSAIEREIDVVANEVGWRHDEHGYLYDHIIPAIFEAPYNRSIGARKTEAAGLTREALLSYYQRHFIADNIKLFIAGPELDTGQLLQTLENTFGKMKKGIETPRLQARFLSTDYREFTPHRVQNGIFVAFLNEPARSVEASLTISTALNHVQRYAHDRTRESIGTSYIYQVSPLNEGRMRSLGMVAYPDPDRTRLCVETFLTNLLEGADHIQGEAVEAARLNGLFLNQNKIPRNAQMMVEDIKNCELSYGDYTAAGDYVRVYEEMTEDTITQAARKLFSQPMATVAYGPKPEVMPTLAEIKALIGVSGPAAPKPRI